MAAPDAAPAPRKPQNAYQLFGAKHRAEIAEELKNNAGGKVPQLGEVQRALGRKWTELGADAKAEFEAEAQKERERFEAASGRNPEASERLQELRRRRQESVPEVLESACELFIADSTQRTTAQGELQAPDAGDAPSDEAVTARLREQWAAMSEEAQQPWCESHKSQTEARAEKLAAWEQSPEGAELCRLEQEHAAAQPAQGPAAAPAAGAAQAEAPAASPPAAAEPAQEVQMSTPSKKRTREPIDKAQDTSPAPTSQPPQEQSADSLGLDEETLKRARRKGLQGALINLAGREDIKVHAFKATELLDALRQSGGLVNSAKRSLLEARAQAA